MTIVLIGFMGAGKSTIGQALADELNKPFIDMDTYIEKQERCTIQAIFSKEGENKFRALESKALTYLLEQDAVIATGGGIVEREENIKLLQENRLNILLDTSLEEMFDRIKNDSTRPNAAGRSFLKIKELYNDRISRYNEIAFMQVDSSKSVKDCVKEIIDGLAQC